MFGVGLHAINELHVRCPELTQADMVVVWFGGGLQGQLPLLLNMFPEVHFENHTPRACPVSVGLWEKVTVTYHNTSFEECLQHIECYTGNRKFAVLIDLDYHLKPGQLTKMNEDRVVPTVESESVHYDRYTAVYDAACARRALQPRAAGEHVVPHAVGDARLQSERAQGELARRQSWRARGPVHEHALVSAVRKPHEVDGDARTACDGRR